MVQLSRFQSELNKSAVCQLKKSLYGLKQAPQSWNSKITQWLHKMGFEVSKSDSSFFIQKVPKGPLCILLFVDDLAKISRVKFQLSAAFEMKDFGDLHYFLEIEVIYTPDDILLTQRHYVLNMMYKFGMTKCRSVSTPLDQNLKLPHKLGAPCDEKRFQQIVGSLIYLTITRPDPSYSVEMISQFMQRPALEHLHCVHRILRYVSVMKDRWLLYGHGITDQLVGYTNVDRVEDVNDRRSTLGFKFSIGSATIAWDSRKQPTRACSSTEPEYRGATAATCEAIWLKRLLQGLHFEVPNLILIYCNNSSSMELAKNPVFHARTKHIEVHYDFVH